MAHTFLSLDMALIPQETKDNVPTFQQGLFSNDAEYDELGKVTKEPSRMLIDGYKTDKAGCHILDADSKKILVHPQKTLVAWLQWSSNPQEIQDQLLGNATEYTRGEYLSLYDNVNSIWYADNSTDEGDY